jgi:hypothetical protein
MLADVFIRQQLEKITCISDFYIRGHQDTSFSQQLYKNVFLILF